MCPGNNPQLMLRKCAKYNGTLPFSMFFMVSRRSQLLLPHLLSSFLNEVELVRFDIAKHLVLTARPLHFNALGARSFA